MRLLLALCLLATGACSAGETADDGLLAPSARATPSPVVSSVVYAAAEPDPPVTASPPPTAPPTPSPTPIDIYHPGPYTVAIDAGHGGPYYWGASGRGADGTLYIEKDLALEVALRLRDLLTANGYNALLTRDGDHTLTPFDPDSYRPSMIADLQARVDAANAGRADLLVSVHFNGWTDASLSGTEAYCNPDRPFGAESCRAAFLIQHHLMVEIRRAGNPVNGLGIRNDAEVNGDPSNEHSYLLGTNANFNPSLMPGVIVETLFLSSPADVRLFQKPGALDAIALGYFKGIDEYFRWLNGG